MSGLSARTYSWGGDAGRFFFAGEAALAPRAPLLRYASKVPALAGADKSSSSVSIDSVDESEDKSESDIVKGFIGWWSIMRDRMWLIDNRTELETTKLYREQAR